MPTIPGSLSFAKLVMMSSAPAKSAGDARYVSQDPFIQSSTVPYNLHSNLYYVERNNKLDSHLRKLLVVFRP